MGNLSSAYKIAEAVVAWGLDADLDDHFQDEYYDDQFFECLNIFIMTISNFSNVFEIEFEEIFSKHCNGNMSEEEYLKFLHSRIQVLGKARGHFGYILPCVFVREIIYRYKSNFKRFHFTVITRNCLAEFLESKLQISDRSSNWYGLMDYCMEINEKFFKLHCKHCLSLNENPTLHGDFMQEPSSFVEIADPGHAYRLLSQDKTVNDKINKLVSSEIVMEDASYMTAYINSGNNTCNDSFVPRTNSNPMLELSKAFSEVFLEDKKEHREADGHDIVDAVYQSKSNNVSCRKEEYDLPFDDDMDEMYNSHA